MERQFIKLTRSVSRKNYDHVKTFGASVTPLPDELLFLTPILNQGGIPKCTAYGSCSLRTSQTNHVYDPDTQWELEMAFVGGSVGSDGMPFKTPFGVGTESGFADATRKVAIDKATAYFFVHKADGNDLFDSCRRAMFDKQTALGVGLNWLTSWDTGVNGVVPNIPSASIGGHFTKIAGWTTIDSIPYLVIQNSWGEGAPGSDNGLYYFSRDIVNKYFDKFGIAYFSDDPNAQVQTLGWLQALALHVLSLLTTLRRLQPTGTFPPPTITQWALAIAKAEGANSYNNPGNLKISSLTKSWGALPQFNATDGGVIARFPDYHTGLVALCNFLQLGKENQLLAFHKARTLDAFTKVYAGNPPAGYYRILHQELGVDGSFNIANFT